MQDELLKRIAEALERVSPPPARTPIFEADAYVWEAERHHFRAVEKINAPPLSMLRGIDHAAAILLANTTQFAAGLPANNALLWGARGTGKSSLVKAAIKEVNAGKPHSLCLIEILHEDLKSLPALLLTLKAAPRRFILFCDDLSFEENTPDYKHLKALLDGGIEGKPENVLLYATSNRRHLMPRQMAENLERSEIHSTEGIDEKVSLSDRFGLWLGFYHCSQPVYEEIVTHYAERFGLALPIDNLLHQANEWSRTRGNRSGRTAFQFIQDLAGRMGRKIEY